MVSRSLLTLPSFHPMQDGIKPSLFMTVRSLIATLLMVGASLLPESPSSIQDVHSSPRNRLHDMTFTPHLHKILSVYLIRFIFLS